jgi:flavin reductase (DIM6/NTAB) family NADH-FMN oxidoreductase RutF
MARVELSVGDPDVRPYPLLTSLVVPRPIAWVSTVSADGVGNLAPHSFFNVVCGEPPMVMFASLGHKDTVTNIEQTGEFVVNLASEPMLREVNNSSARFEAGVDEATALGIALEPSRTVKPPRVANSPAALECVLERIVELPTSYVVFGEVRLIAVDEDALEDGHPAMAHLKPLSRLGRDEWGLPPEVVAIPRPHRPEDIASQETS